MTEHFNPFWANPYKWLYSRIGGRMWTYVMRDFYHRAPLVMIILVLAVGATIGHYVGLLDFLKWLGIGGVGILLGHLFWGTPWVPDQQGLLKDLREINDTLKHTVERLESLKIRGD